MSVTIGRFYHDRQDDYSGIPEALLRGRITEEEYGQKWYRYEMFDDFSRKYDDRSSPYPTLADVIWVIEAGFGYRVKLEKGIKRPSLEELEKMTTPKKVPECEECGKPAMGRCTACGKAFCDFHVSPPKQHGCSSYMERRAKDLGMEAS